MSEQTATANQSNRAAQPPADLSPRIIQLARAIDHLPAGQYTIALVKLPAPQSWQVEISRTVSTKIIDNVVK